MKKTGGAIFLTICFILFGYNIVIVDNSGVQEKGAAENGFHFPEVEAQQCIGPQLQYLQVNCYEEANKTPQELCAENFPGSVCVSADARHWTGAGWQFFHCQEILNVGTGNEPRCYYVHEPRDVRISCLTFQ